MKKESAYFQQQKYAIRMNENTIIRFSLIWFRYKGNISKDLVQEFLKGRKDCVFDDTCLASVALEIALSVADVNFSSSCSNWIYFLSETQSFLFWF